MSITRTLAAALAAGALAVPAAQAAQDVPPAGAPGGEPVPAERWSGAMAAESASVRPQSQASAPAKATDGGGVDGEALAIGFAGTLVAATGAAVVTGRRRQRIRTAG